MMIDLSVFVNKDMQKTAGEYENMVRFGHLGTHFDVMDKVFPLDYCIRPGMVFDVSKIPDRELEPGDIELETVKAGMFVALYSGFIEKEGYGTPRYFKEHPELSWGLIEALLAKDVAIIGVDFAGVRRGKEHGKADQMCADQGAFVVENLCNLAAVLNGAEQAGFTAYTFPINFGGLSGLPCRVAALPAP